MNELLAEIDNLSARASGSSKAFYYAALANLRAVIRGMAAGGIAG